MGFPAKSGSVRTGEWTAEEDEMRSQLADNFKQFFQLTGLILTFCDK